MNYQGVFGFDISKYQDAPDTPAVVDFNKMRDCGASFVIIRVGQGNFIDREWYKHELNSRGILPRAAYWFYDPYYDPELQADLCTTALANKRLEGRIWLDLEFTWGGNFTDWRQWERFINILRSVGYRVGIYTSWSWWDAHAKGADMTYFRKFPLWQAQYPNLTDLFTGWEAMIHQDGTPVMGAEAGVESLEIDHDRWNSNFDFSTEWGGETQPQEVGTMYRYEAVSAFRMSIRPEPNTNNTPITSLPAQTKMLGNVLQGTPGSGECWLEVLSTEYASMAIRGWVAIEHAMNTYCALKDNQPATSTEPPARVWLSYDAGVTWKSYVAE